MACGLGKATVIFWTDVLWVTIWQRLGHDWA